ncbi:MAG: LacI family DNA-binding transcriptional regulator [Chthoniobacterales bacterium]
MDVPPAFPRVTLKDIAKAVGLSHAAVSLALRNSPEVSKATCRRVQEMSQKMGYRPNASATALAYHKKDSKVQPMVNSLAWLNFWPEPEKLRSYREFDLYWEGASASAAKFGYKLEEFVVNTEMSLRRLEQILLTRGITGILLPPSGSTPINWSEFNLERFSVVRLGVPRDVPLVYSVGADQARNTMLAFEKVMEKGYRRIAFVGEVYREWSYGAGFLWAQLMDCPAETRIPPFMLHAREISKYQTAFTAWLEKEKPDAIITELAAIPAMLKKAGYRVPEDIGLATVTVHDCPIDAGIDQNAREIGRVAVLVALSLIHDNAHGEALISRQILIKGRWVDGKCLPKARK